MKSAAEHGTLYQLRNVIRRTNVVSKPIDRFDACDDFFCLVIEALVLHACMEKFEMQGLDGVPCEQYAPHGGESWMMSDEERKELLETLTLDVIDTFTNFSFHKCDIPSTSDKVLLYNKHLLSLGLFYFEYCDAIREGDGIRVLRCWRYLLPMFISSGRTNYAIESFQLIMQHDYYLSEREAAELLWSRFINVHGKPGCNIPNDLHLEHLNRLCKTAIKGLGANKTESCITRVGKALGTIAPILENFDTINKVAKLSGKHHAASSEKDLKLLLDVFKDASVYVEKAERIHPSFPNPRDPLHAITKDKLTTWIVDHFNFK